MIDYKAYKDANNIELLNPVYIDDKLETIDAKFNLYTNQGTFTEKTITIKKDDILSHKNNLKKEREELTARAVILQAKEDAMAEFITDALAVSP